MVTFDSSEGQTSIVDYHYFATAILYRFKMKPDDGNNTTKKLLYESWAKFVVKNWSYAKENLGYSSPHCIVAKRKGDRKKNEFNCHDSGSLKYICFSAQRVMWKSILHSRTWIEGLAGQFKIHIFCGLLWFSI